MSTHSKGLELRDFTSLEVELTQGLKIQPPSSYPAAQQGSQTAIVSRCIRSRAVASVNGEAQRSSFKVSSSTTRPDPASR